MKFADLPLTPAILKSLERMTYVAPTEVQSQTIPLVLEGRDVLVTAQTGTGKTAAFAVPIMQRMIAALESDTPVRRALVLAPTRELAEQIGTVLRELTFFYRRLRYSVIIGGAPYPKQFRELGMDPAFVVGTPGRLIDHLETGTLKLTDFDVLVLDEADRMLDMGFAPQIEMIVSRFPPARQTMMFSATLPPEVRGIVAKYLSSPARVAIGEQNKPVARIKQDVVELLERDKEKQLHHLIDGMAGSIIVFTKTKLRADLVAHSLSEIGHSVAALHGDLGQSQRRRVTASFRDGSVRILVATDIAARGLDIDHVRHVFNYDLPMLPEDYVHRIGRTGRNGAEGHSVAFVTPQEKHRWGQILKLINGRAVGGSPSQRGYKNAASRGAFSGEVRVGGADSDERRTPFTQDFAAARARGGTAAGAPGERGGKTRDDSRGDFKTKSAGAARGKKKSGAKGSDDGIVSREQRMIDAQMRKVREEFQSRVEKAEERQARRLGRDPRFTTDSNRAAAAGIERAATGGAKKPPRGQRSMNSDRPTFSERFSSGDRSAYSPDGARPPRGQRSAAAGKPAFGDRTSSATRTKFSPKPGANPGSGPKPHKGAPDMRKRKPNSRNTKPNWKG